MAAALVSSVVKLLGAIVTDEVALLAGVKKEIESLSSTFSSIQALLVDAERKQVTTEGVRVWLGKIKGVAYEVEDIIDEWTTDASMSQHDEDEDEDDSGKIQKVRSCSLFPCLCFKQLKSRHDIGHRIRKVKEKLNEISKERSALNLEEVNMREDMSRLNKKELETSSLTDESEIFGREEVIEEIIRQLVGETGQKEKPTSIVSIVGMGGLGKTTVAQQVFNDETVEACFEKRVWVCVSDPFDAKRIAIKVIESMGGSTSNHPDLDTLQHSLREALDKKRFLLVLEDVWDESGRLWQILKVPLKSAAPGSGIVVTTRSRSVAEKMETTYIHDLGVLSNSDCWKLFKSIAFKGAEDEECQELREIGEKIVESCKGVPLAIRALGSLLLAQRKKSYWKNVLESEIWKWDLPKDNGILPALLLSYYNLPPHLQRCFSFCSMFPKDYEIEKYELVKLWMAHGIIESVKAKIKSVKAKKDDIEEIGEIYFDDLLTRSLFQDAEKDKYGNIVRCKIHDLVHDLATFVSSGEYCSMEAGDSECSIKCHHLSLLVNGDVSSIPSLLCNVKRLHTLLLFGYSDIEVVPGTLFSPLRYLRVLDLSGTSIKNLPSFIGKLKHLRYLNLGGLEIVELPESVTDLCNLQTLKLHECTDLHTLPRSMSKMVKLQHLEIEKTTNLTVLPNGIGRLTSLRTLSKFLVGDENGGCKIGELKELNLLRGKLKIKNLERVMNVTGASEAEGAELHNKSDLHVLSLSCNDKSDQEWEELGEDEMQRMNSVLEGLRPSYSNLKKLKIKNYMGSMLPRWVEDSRFSSLVNVKLKTCKRLSYLPEGLRQLEALQTLDIYECESLSSLPEGLGQLKALQTLKISSCESLSSLPEGLGQLKALQTLEISSCESLSSLPEGLGQLKALQTLEISSCKSLSSLPEGLGQLKALQTLEISFCESLSSLPEGLRQLKALQTLKISYCKGLLSLPEGLGQLKALQTLRISYCESLSSLPDGLGQLKALQTLEISVCKTLSSLPEGLGQLKALQTLNIYSYESLSSLPEGLGQLKALQTLEIHNCKSLSSLPEGLGRLKALQTLKISFCESLSSLPEGLRQLKALQTLKISYCKGLSSLPERLGQLKALQTLEISFCESLSSLPEGLGQLKALQTLKISYCKGLLSLPEGLGQLKALQTLRISYCERLSSLPEGLGQLKALQTLEISVCKTLSSPPEGLGQLKALQTLNIYSYESLSSLPEGLGQLEALQTLEIHNCKSLSSLPEGLGQLKALQTLEISFCESLSSLPEELVQLKALQTLNIYHYESLSSLPEGLGQLEALQTLEIHNCKSLSSLPEGLGQLKVLQTLKISFCESLSSLPEGLGQLKALQTLQISNCKQLPSLPEGLGHLNALQSLHIECCDLLSSLPKGIGQLKALQTLEIWHCPLLSSLFDGFELLKSHRRLNIWNCLELRPLPNLQRLTALKRISIQRCPLLTEQLKKEKGEDWCKTSHIPSIWIDDSRDEAYWRYRRMLEHY